ncbi:MAG: glycosyltransferase family 2 protein [Oscillochloris sp.]|nr:glycosyltransferase family 2 protein [Oscillochloris sp.]
MDIPIVLIIYRRPDTTAQVLAALRPLRPARLFVVADGPHPDRPADQARVTATRDLIERIEWPCRVDRIYAEVNMGLRRRVESGLHAVFDQVERAVILEDDCIADPHWFRFAQELLDRYVAAPSVGLISGMNPDLRRRRPESASYFFSRYTFCWGWATWRRAWQHYDGAMADWPQLRDSGWLETQLRDRRAVRFWRRVFDAVYAGAVDSWAYRWTYSCWRAGMLGAVPVVNMVSNVGFGNQATHTTAAHSPFAARPRSAPAFPLRHPPAVVVDRRRDDYFQRTLYDPRLPTRILWRLQRLLRRS